MIGIVFKLGTVIPQFEVTSIVGKGLDLPNAAKGRFWLNGTSWRIPDFENIDTFVAKLVRQGLLAHEPLVTKALVEDSPKGLSSRSLQRQFLRATGMTRNTVRQIERARSALLLMHQGALTPEVIDQAGYYDQPHLIRSFAHYLGQRPTQINNVSDWRKLLISTQ
jgi:AraC-like DNA-binding protein